MDASVLSRLGPFVPIVTERVIISNYSYNIICDEHTVDMLFTFKYNWWMSCKYIRQCQEGPIYRCYPSLDILLLKSNDNYTNA
jgi:hypothetical protein